MMDSELDFAGLRKIIGDENSESLLRQGGNFRRKLRLSFDTQIYQYCANERFEDKSYVAQNGPWAGIICADLATVSAKIPEPEELEYIYALCEIGRRGDAQIIDLPVIRAEKRAHSAMHGVFHGTERLDFDIPYTPYPVQCTRMASYSSRIVGDPSAIDTCFRDVAHYGALINHIAGKGQINDVAAFMQADMADVDVFISLDEKFIRPFRQIEERLRNSGVRTMLMRPKQFCVEACLKPIPFPPPNSRQAMGASPPRR